jgi:hypothetical protein
MLYLAVGYHVQTLVEVDLIACATPQSIISLVTWTGFVMSR